MEPVLAGVLITAIATVAAGLVGALAGLGATSIAGRHQRELAREEADRRRDADRVARIRRARLDELARTRRRLIHQIEMLLAAALGKVYRGLSAEPDEATNIGLLGSADLITGYQELLIHLQAKFGAGVSAEDQARATIMEVHVINALARQEERILRDEEPLLIPAEELGQLIEPEYTATRFLALDQQATLTGRLARRLRRDRFRHPRFDDPSTPHRTEPSNR